MNSKFSNNGFLIAMIVVVVLNVLLPFFSGGNPFASFMTWLINLLLFIPGVIIGISVHEFAHAFVAYKLGDMTPKFQGRVTLNPVKHIDPIGLIALVFIGFGWGKPVQVNSSRFKHPRRDNLLTDIAGIVTNFIVAIIFAGLLYLFFMQRNNLFDMGVSVKVMEYITVAFIGVIRINLVLMIFNLLPVPPLDGFGIVTEIFNLRATRFYEIVYRLGFPILIVLLLLRIPSTVIGPIVQFLFDFVIGIFPFP